MYVAIEFHEGIWAGNAKTTGGDSWSYVTAADRYWNPANNINSGLSSLLPSTCYTMSVGAFANTSGTGYADQYIKHVIDTVNDLDNVLYTVINEAHPTTKSFQYHVIDLVHAYEGGKSYQHPIGMSAYYGGGTSGVDNVSDAAANGDMRASNADFMSLQGRNPNDYTTNVLDYSGSNCDPKVSVLDSDHISGFGATPPIGWQWPWRVLMRGHNALYLDFCTDSDMFGQSGPANPSAGIVSDPDLRKHLGYSLKMANRCDLRNMTPQDSDSPDTGYCLEKSNAQEYLVFAPNSGAFHVNNMAAADYAVEWMDASTSSSGQVIPGQPSTYHATAGSNSFNGNSVGLTGGAVLHLTQIPPSGNLITNGSFESGTTGWTITGSNYFRYDTSYPYSAAPPDGTHAITFNNGNTPADTTFSQTVTTVANQSYTLTFQQGLNAWQTTASQTIQVKAQGNSVLNTQNYTLNGTGAGAPNGDQFFQQRTFTFTADSSTTTISFHDVSTATVNIDTQLDDISLTANPNPPPGNLITNGSFESGTTGWTVNGSNYSLYDTTYPYSAAPPDGTHAITFNNGNTSADTTFSQTVTTVANHSYTMTFQQGLNAWQTTASQTIQVKAQGNSVLNTQNYTLTGNGAGAPNGDQFFQQRTFTFTADSSTTTISFEDISTATINIDTQLDDVRLTQDN
jgi:hypothetical protein